jgi:integrase
MAGTLSGAAWRRTFIGKTIQAILRHCNVAVTQNVYIKTVSADSVAAMQQLEKAVSFSDRSQAQA